MATLKLSKKDHAKLTKVANLISQAEQLFSEVYAANYSEMVNFANTISIDNKLRWLADAFKGDMQAVEVSKEKKAYNTNEYWD